MASSHQLEPPSGTRDFLAPELRHRERAFETIRGVFERYGFGPLQTPAFERIEVLTGKYGDEGDKLVFKILRRGEHEASGEADLALRYDLTVPLARVVAAYGSQLPSPYKRYAIAPVWRADRPGKGRFREFVQCDLDIVGSTSPLSDAETVCAVADALDALGLDQYRFLLNSRRALAGLLDSYDMPEHLGGRVLVTLDKLDKLTGADVIAELEQRGLDSARAKSLVEDLTAEDAVARMRAALAGSEQGRQGVAEIDEVLGLVAGRIGENRIAFTPRLVRGLDYYTGVIWEVVAPGMPGSIASGGRYDRLVASLGGPDLPACGGSLGIERILALLAEDGRAADSLDVAITVIDEPRPELLEIAGDLRDAGWRTGSYLGASRKLSKQLRWAADQGARYSVIYGSDERTAGEVTIRDMTTGEQTRAPVTGVAEHLGRLGTG
ncbi:MAG: histidine--tRNA ligase [Pseudonocardiaceae bacterium]